MVKLWIASLSQWKCMAKWATPSRNPFLRSARYRITARNCNKHTTTEKKKNMSKSKVYWRHLIYLVIYHPRANTNRSLDEFRCISFRLRAYLYRLLLVFTHFISLLFECIRHTHRNFTSAAQKPFDETKRAKSAAFRWWELEYVPQCGTMLTNLYGKWQTNR